MGYGISRKGSTKMPLARISPVENAIKVSGDGLVRITIDLIGGGNDMLPLLMNLIGTQFELTFEGIDDESFDTGPKYFG